MNKQIAFIYWSIFLLLLLSIIELTFVSAWSDDGTTIQSVDGCNELNTTNAVYTLTQNISSIDTCFTIAENNITLDCNGYEINYSSDGGNNKHGIYSAYNSTTVKNCKIVEGIAGIIYNSGIYFSNVNNGIIDNNIITTFGYYAYAINLDLNSNYNIISDNIITTYGSYGLGIFLDGDYGNSVLNFNIFLNNRIMTFGDHANGIYFLFGSNNNFLSNNSVDIVDIVDGYGLRLYTSSNNNIINSNFSNVGTVLSSNNTFLNVIYSSEEVYYSELIRKWYLDVTVNYTNGTGINQANITSYNILGEKQQSILTDSNGKSRLELIEYITNWGYDEGTTTYYSNYTINTILSDYDDNSQSVNMSGNKQLNVVLILTPILSEKFSVTGQTIYNLMNSAGAGLGIVITYLSQSIFGFLVLIALICVFSIIGYAVAKTMIESLKNSQR